ncbi:hypothetical protein [Crassaminicella profunda]|uniref:hypothetical protein n=1 Tax=Crassaminicella profunda TaxID=1286698 RepID=UPI001CA6884F|nr:hypothetical protein [Crassaminicella profunda]QZY55634.1 hypothetical protein K7H06_01050 [Crassaminicella profunda]
MIKGLNKKLFGHSIFYENFKEENKIFDEITKEQKYIRIKIKKHNNKEKNL